MPVGVIVINVLHECMWANAFADLPHDTDFLYVIRIIDDLRVIRPYHILIRNFLNIRKTRIPHTQMITDDLKLIYDDRDRKTYTSGGT